MEEKLPCNISPTEALLKEWKSNVVGAVVVIAFFVQKHPNYFSQEIRDIAEYSFEVGLLIITYLLKDTRLNGLLCALTGRPYVKEVQPFDKLGLLSIGSIIPQSNKEDSKR